MTKFFFYLAFAAAILVSCSRSGWEESYDNYAREAGRGNYKEALNWAHKALDFADIEYPSDDNYYAKTTTALYETYYELGDYENALKYARIDSSTRSRTAGRDNNEFAETIKTLGLIYNELGNYNIAETLLSESVTIRRKLFAGENPDLANSLNNLAYYYNFHGRYNEATPLFEEALAMRRKLYPGGSLDLARSLNNLAVCYETLGRMGEAESLYVESLEMRRKLLDSKSPLVAMSIDNLAGFYLGQERYREAENLFREALGIYRDIYKENDPNLAIFYNNIGMFYKRIASYSKAEDFLRKSLDIRRELYKKDHPELASIIENVAGLYSELGMLDKADQLYRESYEMRKRLYSMGHPDLVTSMFNLALNCTRMGNNDEADQLYNDAIYMIRDLILGFFPTFTEHEKSEYWNTQFLNYEQFYNFALTRVADNPSILKDVVNCRLLTKGMLLNSSQKVRRRILKSKNDDLINTYNEWIELRELIGKIFNLNQEQIASQRYNVDSLTKAANSLERALTSKSEDFAGAYDKKEYSWMNIKSALKKGEAAIEIIRLKKFGMIPHSFSPEFKVPGFSDTSIYAALITTSASKNPDLVIINNGNELEDIYLKAYHKLINDTKARKTFPEQIQKGLQELYAKYWEPIAKRLGNARDIYLSPDGVYNLVNINTLINPKNGKYVLDEADIKVVSNLKDILVKKRPSKLARGKALLIGAPKFNIEEINEDQKELYASRKTLQPLPGSDKEISRVNQLLNRKKWQIDTYTGENANESNLKNTESPTILHIATHGEFIEDTAQISRIFGVKGSYHQIDDPLRYSFLYFTGAETTINSKRKTVEDIVNLDDGLLSAYEAMNLNLDNTELVILSACETGLGRIEVGEGAYGMQRAFLVAGARSVLMSLWSIDDEATQKLMDYFYENYLSGMNKRDALRKAQLTLKAEKPEFYYWGAFVIVGE